MADPAVPSDGGDRAVHLLSGAARGRAPSRPLPAPLAPLVLALALTGGCGVEGSRAAATEDVARERVARGEALVAALAERLGGGAGPASADGGRGPGLHPEARAESVEIAAVLDEEGGATHVLHRRFDRLAVRTAADPPAPAGIGFGFTDVWRLSGTVGTSEPGVEAVRSASRDALERAALGLAEGDRSGLRVRDAALALSPGAGCALTYALSEGGAGEGGDGGSDALELTLRREGCPDTVAAGALLVATDPTLAVTGTLVVDGTSRPVAGRGWVRRAWGSPPAPGGAVVFDRLLLELDDGRRLDAARSKRRSGRGPQVTSASLAGGDAKASAEDVEWLDAAANGAAPSGEDAGASGVRPPSPPASWTLRVPSAGIDVTLEPIMDMPVREDAFGRVWRGGVIARGSHGGIGFVEFLPLDAEGSAPASADDA